MFERINRGWNLAKASFAVLRDHPKLLVFPILTIIIILAMATVIGMSAFAEAKRTSVSHVVEMLQANQVMFYALAFALYFACTFFIIFFNTALIFCVMQYFDNKEPSLLAGLTSATKRLPQVIAWALVATTVGLLLNALTNFLRDKLGFIGSMLGALGELSWAIATYFVLPIVVVEGMHPIKAVKTSIAIMRRTWGEALGAEASFGLLFVLLVLPAIAVLGLAIAFGKNLGLDVTAFIALAVIIMAYFFALAVVFNALSTIFLTGAYIYATTGVAPSSMDQSVIQSAFRKR
jgi:hypothetical protein